MDFGSISGKGSMKRKQSTSLLQALGKSSSSSRSPSIPIPPPSSYAPPTSTSSHFSDSTLDFSPEMPSGPYDTATASSARTSSFSMPLQSARSLSGTSTTHSLSTSSMGQAPEREKKMLFKRPDDVFRVVKDRVFSWSYLMQWYQGDIHWFNTVKISRSALETSLGPSKVEQRARYMFQLGTSLSPLFDITTAPEFLRSLVKLLDEWEAAGDGGKGVMGLFRAQRTGKKSIGYDAGVADGEVLLLNAPMPFAPDFFIAHSILCSAIRDIYKKFLGMVLPPHPSLGTRGSLPNIAHSGSASSTSTDPHNLFHPSTIIHSAALPESGSNPLSPVSTAPSTWTGTGSGSANGHSDGHGMGALGGVLSPLSDPIGLHQVHKNNRPTQTQQDGFQALIAGELSNDRILVGDGQKLTPSVIEMFSKVDTKLRKHFSMLLREGDSLAKKVLDDELAILTASLNAGAPIRFDAKAGANGPSEWNAAGATPGTL